MSEETALALATRATDDVLPALVSAAARAEGTTFIIELVFETTPDESEEAREAISIIETEILADLGVWWPECLRTDVSGADERSS